MRRDTYSVGYKTDYRMGFLEPVCIRTWEHNANRAGFFKEELQVVRSASGRGVLDPYRIEIDKNQVSSLTLGEGESLQERIKRSESFSEESWLRGFAEEVCFGLDRVHRGLGQAHKALCPYNLFLSADGEAKLWSLPTLEIEQSRPERRVRKQRDVWLKRHRDAKRVRDCLLGFLGADEQQEGELPSKRLGDVWKAEREDSFFAPEEPNLSPLSDIYSLGRLLMRLILGLWPPADLEGKEEPEEELLKKGLSEDFVRVVLKCIEKDPLDRFLGAFDLAKALNPNTDLLGTDVKYARELTNRALGEFKSSGCAVEEFFFEASLKDPFGTAAWNNLAVLKMKEGDFLEALHSLEKAYSFSSSHPKVLANISYCLLGLDDLEACNFWARRVLEIEPGLALSYFVIAVFNTRKKNLPHALFYSQRAAALSPRNKKFRLFLAETLEKVGMKETAELERLRSIELVQSLDFYECFIDESRDPPWGDIRDESEPDFRGPNDGGSRVPLLPKPPRRSASIERDYPPMEQ